MMAVTPKNTPRKEFLRQKVRSNKSNNECCRGPLYLLCDTLMILLCFCVCLTLTNILQNSPTYGVVAIGTRSMRIGNINNLDRRVNDLHMVKISIVYNYECCQTPNSYMMWITKQETINVEFCVNTNLCLNAQLTGHVWEARVECGTLRTCLDDPIALNANGTKRKEMGEVSLLCSRPVSREAPVISMARVPRSSSGPSMIYAIVGSCQTRICRIIICFDAFIYVSFIVQASSFNSCDVWASYVSEQNGLTSLDWYNAAPNERCYRRLKVTPYIFYADCGLHANNITLIYFQLMGPGCEPMKEYNTSWACPDDPRSLNAKDRKRRVKGDDAPLHRWYRWYKCRYILINCVNEVMSSMSEMKLICAATGSCQLLSCQCLICIGVIDCIRFTRQTIYSNDIDCMRSTMHVRFLSIHYVTFINISVHDYRLRKPAIYQYGRLSIERCNWIVRYTPRSLEYLVRYCMINNILPIIKVWGLHTMNLMLKILSLLLQFLTLDERVLVYHYVPLRDMLSGLRRRPLRDLAEPTKRRFASMHVRLCTHKPIHNDSPVIVSNKKTRGTWNNDRDAGDGRDYRNRASFVMLRLAVRLFNHGTVLSRTKEATYLKFRLRKLFDINGYIKCTRAMRTYFKLLLLCYLFMNVKEHMPILTSSVMLRLVMRLLNHGTVLSRTKEATYLKLRLRKLFDINSYIKCTRAMRTYFKLCLLCYLSMNVKEYVPILTLKSVHAEYNL